MVKEEIVSLDTSPYILRASIRAKRLEKKLAAGDCLPEDDGRPSSQDDETPADPAADLATGLLKAAAINSR